MYIISEVSFYANVTLTTADLPFIEEIRSKRLLNLFTGEGNLLTAPNVIAVTRGGRLQFGYAPWDLITCLDSEMLKLPAKFLQVVNCKSNFCVLFNIKFVKDFLNFTFYGYSKISGFICCAYVFVVGSVITHYNADKSIWFEHNRHWNCQGEM